LHRRKNPLSREVFVPEKESWKAREGFEAEKVVSGLSLRVNLTFVPDPKKAKGSPLFYVIKL